MSVKFSHWPTEEANPWEQPNTKKVPEKQNLVVSDQDVMICETTNSQGQLEFSAPAHQSILTDREIKRRDDKHHTGVSVNRIKHERAQVTTQQASD